MNIISRYNELNQDDKNQLSTILRNNNITEENIENIFMGAFLTKYIAYQNLSRHDRISIGIILIKLLMQWKGSFNYTPDNYQWLAIMLKHPPEFGDVRSEKDIFQFINIAIFLSFQNIRKNDYMIDLLLEPITSISGASIAGFCLYPLIESLCRRKSSFLNNTGIAQEELRKMTFRGTKIDKRKGNRVNNIRQELLIVEKDLDEFLAKSLIKLDEETGIYSIIEEKRNAQLHGALLGSVDALIFVFFLHLYYL